jgi:two-component system, OmpR family, alkaline phosphatase synthesis response regulator PhoP
MTAPAVAPPIVLVVDDDDDIRELVSFKLRMAGYQTLVAANGYQALHLAEAWRPQAMVLDIAMPGMDGLTVAQQLQLHAATADIPVLILSARDQQGDIELGFAVGVDDYMVKPFSPHDLVGRVEWLMRTAAVRQARDY